MKEGVCLFFGRQHIAQFIETEERNFGIEIDQAIEVLRFGEFGGEMKERDKDGLIAFQDGIVADGRGKVGFTDPGRTGNWPSCSLIPVSFISPVTGSTIVEATSL